VVKPDGDEPKKEIAHEISLLKELKPTLYKRISNHRNISAKDWKIAEKNCVWI
jgi:hypothetical protein